MRRSYHCLLLITAILLTSLPLSAQTGFRWAYGGGGSLYDEGAMDVATDPEGNIYMAAYHETGATFMDTTLGAHGASDLIVAKLSPYGELIWLDQRGNTAPDRATSVFATPDGSLFMAGYGKVSYPRHTRDALTARYYPDGSLAWGRYMDGDQYSEGWDIVADDALSCYMAGTIKVDGWYGTDTIHGHGGKDAYLLKFDSTGSLGWYHAIGGTGDDEANSLAIDPSGNLYMAGYFSGTADFGNGISRTSQGSIDGYVAKYSPAGNAIWVHQFGGAQTQEVNALKVAPDGSIYFTGEFTGAFTTTAGTLTSIDFYDIFLGKLNASGTLEWIESVGGPNMQLPQDIDIDAKENIYLGGIFFGSLTIGPTTVNSGAYDNLFLAKLDSSGTLVFLKDAYFPLDSRGIGGVAVDAAENVTACGYYSQELSLGADTLHSVQNTIDFFVAKYATQPFTITLDTLIGSPLCAQDLFEVHFSVQGLADSGNVFYLELSSNTGSFSQPDTVGISYSAVGGMIQGTVPLGLAPGNGYRVRVRASAPGLSSNDNGQDITLDPSTSVPVLISGDSVICNGVPVLLLIDTSFVQQVWSTGDTANFVIISAPGLYWVEATDANGCTNRDEHLVSACVGLSEMPGLPDLLIWPNPASDQVFFQWKGTNTIELTLLDISGRVSWKGISGQGETVAINTAGLSRGVYTAVVQTASGRAARSLIVLR